MIKLELTVTFTQFTAIANIITPSQLLAMSEILEDTPRKPEDALEPSKGITIDNESCKGFVRPKTLAAALEGAVLIADEIDPYEDVSNMDIIHKIEKEGKLHTIPKIAAPTATRKKGGKTGPIMPGLGRSQAQVDKFVKHEAERTEDLDEEEELREQRHQEKLAKKAVKDEEEAEKKLEAKQAQDEIDDIKAKEIVNNQDIETKLAPKPWNLKGNK